MIRYKFIAGQRQCALRQQLDGFAQDTPIGEIVDSCRVWESYSDPKLIADGNHDSDAEHQSGDFRTQDVTKAATGRQIARNSQPWEGRQVQSGIQRNQTVRPVQVPRIWTGCQRVPRRRLSGNRIGGCGRLKKCGLPLTRTGSNGHGESRRP